MLYTDFDCFWTEKKEKEEEEGVNYIHLHVVEVRDGSFGLKSRKPIEHTLTHATVVDPANNKNHLELLSFNYL